MDAATIACGAMLVWMKVAELKKGMHTCVRCHQQKPKNDFSQHSEKSLGWKKRPCCNTCFDVGSAREGKKHTCIECKAQKHKIEFARHFSTGEKKQQKKEV